MSKPQKNSLVISSLLVHLWMQFVEKYPNYNLHQLFDLHIQHILSLDANDDNISKS